MLFLQLLGLLFKCVIGFSQNVSWSKKSYWLLSSIKKAILSQFQKVTSPPIFLVNSKFSLIPLFPTPKTIHQQVLSPLSPKYILILPIATHQHCSHPVSPPPFLSAITSKLVFLPLSLPLVDTYHNQKTFFFLFNVKQNTSWLCNPQILPIHHRIKQKLLIIANKPGYHSYLSCQPELISCHLLHIL